MSLDSSEPGDIDTEALGTCTLAKVVKEHQSVVIGTINMRRTFFQEITHVRIGNTLRVTIGKLD